MKNIFFTSDTHFCSPNIVKRENRPFKNIKRCDKFTIKTWNKQAKKEDIIYHLGDFVNCNDQDIDSWKTAVTYIKKIKAKVILIIGNNEQKVIEKFFDNDFLKFRDFFIARGFADVKNDDYLSFLNQNFYLNHYPKNHKDNYINLFGHTHRATGLWKPFGFNLGVDLNHFKLFSETDIKKLIYLKNNYWDTSDDNLA